MSKKTNDSEYEGFTLSLALVDAVPVLFFGASCILLGMIFDSSLFIIGACLCFAAGLGKVIWKVILAVRGCDVSILNRQFRYSMISGFLIIIISVIINIGTVSFSGIINAITAFPAIAFYIIWVIGMTAMIILGKKLDSSVARNNWIEQFVNSIAQVSFFTALLCTYLSR